MKRAFSILFALALVLSLSLVAATPVMAQSWLSGWSHRIKITIDSTKIDAALVDFPVLLYLSTSSGINPDDVSFVFDELGTEKLKLAVTTGDGTTQCYVEIEKWDSISEQAWLWVKVPYIATGADTTLYLYYDHTQPDNTARVGETGTTPAQNVWDSDFVGVWHNADDPFQAILDSTSYVNDGTKKGNNEPQQVDGKIGKAQKYDGADDYVDFGSDASLKLSGNLTVELWVNRVDKTTFERFLSHSTDANTFAYEVGVDYLYPDQWRLFFNSGAAKLTAAMIGDPGDWIHVAFVYDKDAASDNMKIYENGSLVASMDYSQALTGHGTLRTNRQGKADGWLKSTVDEVRISSLAHSAAWVRASYHSEDDSLLSYGSQESGPPPSPVVGWETYPINKVRVLLPWIALCAAIAASASLLVLRRRRAQI
jgi:biopolymer transport protein ExbB